VQVELDAFFALLSRRTRLSREVTASAFSKARSRLRANVFDLLNDELLRLVDAHLPEAPRWQDLRVLAVDASKVRLTLLDGEGRRGIREATLFGLFRPGTALPPPNRGDAVDYECPRQVSIMRLIRQVMPTGKVRMLMMSLLDAERYPVAVFADLYHQRWQTEEALRFEAQWNGKPG